MHKESKENIDSENLLASAKNALMNKNFCLLNKIKENFLKEALEKAEHDLVIFAVIGYELEPLQLAVSHLQNPLLWKNLLFTRESLIHQLVNRNIGEFNFPTKDMVSLFHNLTRTKEKSTEEKSRVKYIFKSDH